MTLAERLARGLAEGRSRDVVLLPGDLHDDDPGAAAPAPAAVLVAVTDRAEPGLILTRRTATMRRHPGQVAFPGGRVDPGDDGPVAAALREAEEEIALPRARVEVVGTVAPYRTITGYSVTPVLAVIPPDLPLVPHEAEVADVFEVPFGFVLDAANQREVAALRDGRERRYFEIVWQDRRIWGATAAMLVNLSRRLAWPG